jgi:hypothetical protein
MKNNPMQNARALKGFFYALFFGLIFTSVGCNLDWLFPDDDPDPIENESVTVQINSSENGGDLVLGGTTLRVPPNSIPSMSDGSASDVSFTIESGAELPKVLPEGMTTVAPVTHFGPEGFIFQDVLWLQFEIPDGLALDQISIVSYLPDTKEYGIIPITFFDEANGTVGASVYELGYYFLVNIEGVNRLRTPNGCGGFILNYEHTNGWYPATITLPNWADSKTYYKIVVTEFTPKYPQDIGLWAPYDPDSNGGRRYWEFMTPPVTTGWGPNHDIGIKAFGIPQGEYTALLVASYKEFQQDLPICKTYSKEVNFTVGSPVVCQQVWGCSGWALGPNLPDGGSWVESNCLVYNPDPTVPVCTGDFQATLTWYNGNDGDTDLDLHLYGPDGLSVFYGNKNPGIGGIILDRDIIDEPGPVQENICAPSLSAMPKGAYEVKVDHYSGDQKAFQVRVLVGSKSSSFQGTLSPGDAERLVYTFSIN